jgi:hypothetical protein
MSTKWFFAFWKWRIFLWFFLFSLWIWNWLLLNRSCLFFFFLFNIQQIYPSYSMSSLLHSLCVSLTLYLPNEVSLPSSLCQLSYDHTNDSSHQGYNDYFHNIYIFSSIFYFSVVIKILFLSFMFWNNHRQTITPYLLLISTSHLFLNMSNNFMKYLQEHHQCTDTFNSFGSLMSFHY